MVNDLGKNLMQKIDELEKSHISPPLVGGDKGEGGVKRLNFKGLPPSPQPSPIKGEGVLRLFTRPSRLKRTHFGQHDRGLKKTFLLTVRQDDTPY